MSIHSHLPFDQSTSHARIPAGGIHLIASIDSVSEAQVTASFFGSTKALHGEVAIPSAETTTHNHSNQQYSITAITTSAGAIAERYAYSAYGEPTICDASGSQISNSSINNRYSYTGREWDATVGLHHFRARWMSPKTGRFLTRDPIGYFSMDWNLSRFVFNQPLVQVDPSGLKCKTYVLITHGPNTYQGVNYLPTFIAGLNLLNPEFDKCDKVAPFCCWQSDGKKVCIQHYLPTIHVVPQAWPHSNNGFLNTAVESGFNRLAAMFRDDIPAAMKECCNKDSKQKCGCTECYTEFVCHDHGPAGVAPIVGTTYPWQPPKNPCKQLWTWSCAQDSWIDRDKPGTVVYPKPPATPGTR
jgi:RHS repeat-associated protein